MGTIKEKLNYLNETKNQIKEAIKSKDVEVSDSDNFRSYADKIKNIKDGKLEPLEIKFLIDESQILHIASSNTRVNIPQVLTTILDCDLVDIDASYLFKNFSYLKTIKKIKISEKTNIEGLFFGCSGLTEIPKLNISNITNISRMFDGCTNLTQIPLLDTSEVTNMQEMFDGCTNLTQIPLLDTRKVTNMIATFARCYALETIPKFNTSKVINMQEMFNYCTNLTQIPLLDTSEVTNMQDMFYNCKKLTEIPKLNTSNVTNMKEMFCSSGIKTIPALDCGNVNNFLDATASCKDLTNLEGFINLGKAYTYQTEKYGWYTLKLSSCTQLTHDSLINVINNLYDLNLTYDVANGGTLYRQDLIIGSENKAKLTEEEIKIATDKGWDVT